MGDAQFSHIGERIAKCESLNGSHVQNPFLLREDVQRLYNLVFSANSTQAALSKQDLYQTLMVLAIGSIHIFRNGICIHHPYGYYAAAMQYLDPNIFSGGIESIQNLLLVVRFGIYHHIGTHLLPSELHTKCHVTYNWRY